LILPCDNSIIVIPIIIIIIDYLSQQAGRLSTNFCGNIIPDKVGDTELLDILVLLCI